jgi:nitrite reductase (NADH) small subunit
MSLSRGLIGESKGEPKVACPFHKKTFSLQNGNCLSDPDVHHVKTNPVKIVDGFVLIGIT